MKCLIIVVIFSLVGSVAAGYLDLGRNKPCRYGFDIFDCVSGECNNITKQCTCDNVHCRKECHTHWKQEADGCGSSCKCADTGRWNLMKEVRDNGCPELRCGLDCNYGYVIWEYGCPICACKEEETRKPCRKGYDSFDCERGSRCNSLTGQCSCLPLKCSLQCPMGLHRNLKGCEVCECARLLYPSAKKDYKTCPRLRCTLKCKYGYMRNVKDCDVCYCARKMRELTPEEQEWQRCINRNKLKRWWDNLKNKLTEKQRCVPPVSLRSAASTQEMVHHAQDLEDQMIFDWAGEVERNEDDADYKGEFGDDGGYGGDGW